MAEQISLSGDPVEIVELPSGKVKVPKDKLEKWYIEDELSVQGIADKLSTSRSSAARLLDLADVSTRSAKEQNKITNKRKREEREYIDANLLTKLHHEKELSLSEIGERFGVTNSAISYWMNKFEIDVRDPTKELPKFTLSYESSSNSGNSGYPIWYNIDPQVPIHKLVVIAEGADPYDVFANPRMNVHHRNMHKCDNRPSNLELVDRNIHGKMHSTPHHKWTDDDIKYAIRFMLNLSNIPADAFGSDE